MAKRKLIETPLFDPIDELQREAHAPRKHLRLITGEELKEQGMARAVQAVSPTYRALLQDALLLFPIGRRITAEHLTKIAGRPPDDRFNSVGGIVAGMAKRGLLRKTGRMIKAERPGMHATELAEWEVIAHDKVKV